MKSSSRSRLALVATAAAFLSFCGGSKNGPSDDAVADFITGIVASDGSRAVLRAGSPPTPNGGPDLQVTASGSVASGGVDSVRLRSASPFNKVYAGVQGTDGYYELALTSSTQDVTITNSVASSVPSSTYLASYRAASPAGLVGNPATVNNTVAPVVTPPSGTTNVTGTWNSAGQPTWILTQTGTTVTGSNVFPAFPTDPSYTVSFTGTITGTMSGNTLTATNTFSFTESGAGVGLLLSCTQVSTITATVSGNTMTGTYTSGNLNCVTNLVGFPSTFAGSSGPFTLTR